MVTDPKSVIKELFDSGSGSAVTTGNLLEEDGVTKAKFEADYPYSELMLHRLMLEAPLNLDIIFIISLIREPPPDNTPSGPICYNYIIGVQPVTIYKYNSDGTLKVNAVKLARAANEEVKRVIRENPYGSLRNVQGRNVTVDRVGSGLVYGDVTEVLYKQYATVY